MKAQREKILNQLSAHGWKAVPLEDYELEWWADEIWMLESIWSPIGTTAYITFLVDPQIPHIRARKKGESVWAVMTSRYRNVEEEVFEMSLKQGWEKRLPEFFEHLDKIRNSEDK